MLGRFSVFLAILALARCAPGDDPSTPDAPTPNPNPSRSGDLEAPPYDMSVVDTIDCEDVSPWDESIFGDGPDAGDLKIQKVQEGSFMGRAGFGRYTRVFGIPVVVSDNMGAVTLGRAARSLASLLDNDGDGEPDEPLWVESMLKYRVIFGYFSSGEESEDFWRNADKRSSYRPFMEQYLCNMHFVEIWQADLSPLYYTAMMAREPLLENGTLQRGSPNILKRCGTATTDDFDLSQWYYLFSIYYYGIVDHIAPETAEAAESAMQYIQDSRGFNPHYAADPEMTLADFLAWGTLTKMGALECHCTQTSIQNHWRPCQTQDLPQPLIALLDDLPGIPTKIPNPNYPKPRGSDEPPMEATPDLVTEPESHTQTPPHNIDTDIPIGPLEREAAEAQARRDMQQAADMLDSDLPATLESDLPATSDSDLPVTLESDLPVTSDSDLPVTLESDLPVTSDSDLPVTSDSDLPVTLESGRRGELPEGLVGEELAAEEEAGHLQDGEEDESDHESDDESDHESDDESDDEE